MLAFVTSAVALIKRLGVKNVLVGFAVGVLLVWGSVKVCNIYHDKLEAKYTEGVRDAAKDWQAKWDERDAKDAKKAREINDAANKAFAAYLTHTNTVVGYLFKQEEVRKAAKKILDETAYDSAGSPVKCPDVKEYHLGTEFSKQWNALNEAHQLN